MRITSITPVKNEGPYILEWVAHNRMIGINDMLVFSNHCSDFSDLILERLDELGLVRHMINPSVRMTNTRHSIELFRYLNESPRLRRSDWVTHLDVDAFIRVKVGHGRLEDLLDAVPHADALSLSLHTFGCSGNDDILPGGRLVTETFRWREESDNRRAPVKYLARGAFSPSVFVNNASELCARDLARINWVNGNGHKVPIDKIGDLFKPLPARTTAFDLVDVAHYAVRSFQGFLLQSVRGNANPAEDVEPPEPDLKNTIRHWDRFNRNEIKDEISVRGKPDLREAADELLQDDELADLHDASVEWHRTRAEELLKTETYLKLYRTIQFRHEEAFPDVLGFGVAPKARLQGPAAVQDPPITFDFDQGSHVA